MEIWNTPGIVKESSRGYDRFSILDDMLLDRKINCVMEINEDTVNSLIMQILYLEKQDPAAEITVYINSPGGSVQDGLALYDVMQAVSCPIRTICIGIAASMASILFAAGDRRQMLAHSRVMIHDPRIFKTGGTALELQTISENLMKTRAVTAEILSKHTGRSAEEILEKTRTDSYFSADEAVGFGLADEIITKL